MDGADVLGVADREGTLDKDGAKDGTRDIDGLWLMLGALEGMVDGTCDAVGSGFTLGAILMLGLLEVEGTDDCVGINDVVGFCDAAFEGALLILGLLEAEGGGALVLGRLDCEGVAEGPIEGSCEATLMIVGAPLLEGEFETVGLDGLNEAVGCPPVFST